MRAGKSSKISATVKPSNATNKKLKWKSSNPSVATVDSKGNVTGKGNGQATITATAKDGSGKAKSITVYSHKYTKNDTQWIAHRGLHTNATENSAAAFEAAGKAGFWGCECDLYETKRTKEDVSNDEEEGEGEGEGEEGEDPIVEEHFELVIDHDGNFKRVFGVNKAPTDLTAEQIRSNSKLAEVCFFDEYLKICKKYNMVPIVEIKMLSDEGVEKMIDMLYDAHLLEYAQIISFKAALLEKTQGYAFEKYAIKPYTGYLLTGNEDKVENGIETAVEKGFSGVNIKYSLFTEDISDICRINGLGVCTWTYRDSAVCNHNLYKHVVSGKYKVDSITVDGKYF